MAAPAALPTGTVTFLFTDVEGSTRLWERYPDQMRTALARHDALIEAAVEEHGGVVVRPRGEGDSRFAVFARATDGVAAAVAVQRALQAEPWPPEAPLRVRLAVHTGDADLREGDYCGSAVNRAARLRAVAHGGQALVSEVAGGLARDALPPGAGLRDLGEHRLKDLLRPERVFQLVHPELPADFPPLASLGARPHNLPVQPTPFIGRERELAALRERVLRPEVRLLTLTGPGGTGKTRLALQVAADLLDAFPDGTFLVGLAPVADPALVPAAVAQALGVREGEGQPLLEALRDHLRARRLLLVLDNFEQVAAAAPVVADLLAAAPALKALVTTRAVLHLSGEHDFAVPPLTLPDPERLPPPDRLTQYEAVRLFVERARAARADFAVTNENASAVAEICARLDGLPLAIELAAARSRLLSPRALLARLASASGGLPLLTGGARDLPARQQTLRAAIDWSCALLEPGEQALFARLAVFVGGCPLEAAEAVCDPGGDLPGLPMEVLDGLGSLVDKSLLRQEDEPDGAPRFAMLETIRAYALERLAAGADLPPAVRAGALMAAGVMAAYQRDYEPARAAYGEGLALYRAQANWRGEAGILGNLAWLALAQKDFHRAAQLSEESLAIFRELGDQPNIAICLHRLGSLAHRRGDHALARTSLQESLALRRAIGDHRGVIPVLVTLAKLELDEDAWAAARRVAVESLTLAHELSERERLAPTLDVLAGAAAGEGDAQRAARLWGAAEALQEALGTEPPEVDDPAHRRIEAARARAGAAAFAAAWQEGQAMPLEEAVAYALEESAPDTPAPD